MNYNWKRLLLWVIPSVGAYVGKGYDSPLIWVAIAGLVVVAVYFATEYFVQIPQKYVEHTLAHRAMGRHVDDPNTWQYKLNMSLFGLVLLLEVVVLIWAVVLWAAS